MTYYTVVDYGYTKVVHKHHSLVDAIDDKRDIQAFHTSAKSVKVGSERTLTSSSISGARGKR